MMKYVLVKIEKEFYDGHGEPDCGGVTFKVEHTDEYNELDFSKAYTKSWQGWEDADEMGEQISEDGYNCEVEIYSFKQLTDIEYNEYQKIISGYNGLKNIL